MGTSSGRPCRWKRVFGMDPLEHAHDGCLFCSPDQPAEVDAGPGRSAASFYDLLLPLALPGRLGLASWRWDGAFGRQPGSFFQPAPGAYRRSAEAISLELKLLLDHFELFFNLVDPLGQLLNSR